METSDRDLGVTLSPVKHAERLARLDRRSNAGWMAWPVPLCEAVRFKQAFGAAFKLVTLGIRPAGSEAGDQRRIMTPGIIRRRRLYGDWPPGYAPQIRKRWRY